MTHLRSSKSTQLKIREGDSRQISDVRIKRPGWALVVHSIRVGIVVVLLLLIPSPVEPKPADQGQSPELTEIQRVLPLVKSMDRTPDASGLWTLFDEPGKRIGRVARTSPVADDIVGYRGPTESLIILDLNLNIIAVRMLHSADTEEHVQAMLANEIFFKQFEGWPWGGPGRRTPIDGVSGATLTSLALAKSVLKRMGGNRPSLYFPDSLTVDELRDWFPEADAIDDSATASIVLDKAGAPIGRVLRTGPFCDDITGYRGPSELLLKLDQHNRVEKIQLRGSYETEAFQQYMRDEPGFWAIFENQTLGQLAKFDPAANGVEGVSGATMTSIAIADTIVAAARKASTDMVAESAASAGSRPLQGTRWSPAEIATVVLLALAALSGRWHWFGQRWFRRVWLAVVVIVIGFWAGNLVSMALVAGWSAAGIAWQLAPGLAAITMLTFLTPPIMGGNPYCNHLCPHGAMQQLIKPSRMSWRRIHPSRWASSWLQRIAAITLIAAYVALILRPRMDLSSWEPFHAYLFQIAGWGSIGLAIGSLALSSVIPMGYCRYGCPTGSLLSYIRRSARSDRLHAGDVAALCLLVFACYFRA